MADKVDKNPENHDEYLPSKGEVEAWLNSEDFDSDGGDEPVAIELGEAEPTADPISSERDPCDDDGEVNPNKGLSFSVPAPVEGEQLVPYSQLRVWEHHPAATSRARAANFEALCESANDPANIPPLEVIETEDGIKIIDGRLRFFALGAVHGEASNVGVRCKIFEGSEKEALEKIADSAVGEIPRTPIEQARAIWNLQKIGGISQKAVIERYKALKKDQVSLMTIAARTVERFPSVFCLLAEPDRVAIDVCVKFARWVKDASDEELGEVLETAEALMNEGAALKSAGLLDALGIETEKTGSKSKAAASEALETIPVFGADDQPIGMVEKLDERVMRFQLPDPVAMTHDEREEAAQKFIKEILDYFGLKNPD